MKAFAGLILCVPFLIYLTACGVSCVSFDRNCEGRLKRAADANTVELAKQELGAAIGWLKATGKTSGYTSIMYTTPDEDVGFWFKNLESSLAELERSPADASQMQTSNLLIKLRETLLDHKEKGTAVTFPDGMPLYPNNVQMAVVGWGTFLVALVGGILIVVWLNECD